MKKALRASQWSRRNFIHLGAGIVGTGSLTAWFGTSALAQSIRPSRPQSSDLLTSDPGTPHSTLTPDQSLEKLLEGNRRFVTNRRTNGHQDAARIAEVASEQAPFAAILGCADSRVVPEIVFDQGIGDLFVVRVAGNLAITENTASEEFAVGVLGVPLIMVMGHERCGAVQAALNLGELPGVIESLVYALRPAVEASAGQPGDPLTNAIKENVRMQVKRLQISSVLSAPLAAGRLKIVGAYYDLDTGEVSLI
jgi:carbonic anhydrase